MEERQLRHWIERVKDGTITRREFTRMVVGLGLTAPMAAQMLASAGVAQAQTKGTYAPTKRGGGGPVRVLWWQGATLLNPHFASGTKDQDGSRIFYEPLASYDPDGNIVPVLAAETPTLQNGGVAKDGTSVTWKLKRNVQWHDGKPFTADDVVFNWEYAVDPATAAVTTGQYADIKSDRQAGQPHRQDHVQERDAVLVGALLRPDRPDHPEAHLRGVQGREVAGGAGQPQAGRHRPVPVSRTSSRATW